MRFHPQLITAKLVKRYKRFLADVELDNKNIITVHCPNPGSMLGMKNPGSKVWISDSNNPKRKLRYTLELIEVVNDDGESSIVGVNTNKANAIAREAIEMNLISTIPKDSDITPEQRYGENSRIDFLIKSTHSPDIYIEVKSVTLLRNCGLYEFPDSVTARGTKHLSELTKIVQNGNRAIMLFLTQRSDGNNFTIAKDIDPKYNEAFINARKAGVEAYCIQCIVDKHGIEPQRLVKIV